MEFSLVLSCAEKLISVMRRSPMYLSVLSVLKAF